jgi:hypothetical protein
MDKLHVRSALAAAMVLLAIAGCSGSGSGGKTGQISIGVSDGPMHDATKVCIAFNEIELKPREGPPILADKLMDAAETINVNLLDFPGMNAAPLLIDYDVLAGEYLWLRLGVNAALGGMGGIGDTDAMGPCLGVESYLMTGGLDGLDGITYNLYIPSGAESGLKLHGSIIVPQGGAADFTAEVDLMKSVTYPDGLMPDAVFRPTLRLVNNVEVGAITGQVANELVVDGCAPTVFVFEDDMMDVALDVNNSFASALVEEQTNEYHYTIGFLPEGLYEAAFSCDDGITLQPTNGKPNPPLEIIAGDVDRIDFP